MIFALLPRESTAVCRVRRSGEQRMCVGWRWDSWVRRVWHWSLPLGVRRGSIRLPAVEVRRLFFAWRETVLVRERWEEEKVKLAGIEGRE